MSAPQRHLHVVGNHVLDEAGEVQSPEALRARIEQLETDLKMAQRDVRSKNRRISELERNKALEREQYADREKVERIHSYWNRRLGQEKALTADRFDAVRGILEEVRLVVPEGGGRARKEPAYVYPDDFKRAIDGAWFDPFITKQRNGRVKRHDDLALICRDGKTFDSFIERAPEA